jgi:predicted transposase YbfD/YdcC
MPSCRSCPRAAANPANRIVLGQVKTEDKSNEVTAIPELLDVVDVKGALVSIDAAGTQTAIADKIVDKGGAYLLAVKGDQPTLHGALIEHFAGAEDTAGVFSVGKTEEHAHGRDELRRAGTPARPTTIGMTRRTTASFSFRAARGSRSSRRARTAPVHTCGLTTSNQLQCWGFTAREK